jgi:N-acetylmuramoyl-L-alanine amidase
VDSSVAFEELRFRSYPSFTRIVVEAAAGLSYLAAAGRSEIRVRLSGLNVPGVHLEEIGDGLVKEARLEAAGPDGVLNIVLEGSAAEVKTASLQDPFRVVVDIYRAKESAGTDGARTNTGGASPLKLIVLDAGHGGHDPGAKGPNGVQEKDVVLDVTQRAARMIEDGLGIKVVRTRSTDVFVPLRERTNFANKQRADLFVSIHANAHPRSLSEGVETYFLSSEATDNEARQSAAFENNVVQLENPQSRQKTDLLKSILWDMAQSEFQQESSFLAETVQDSMTQSLRLTNRGVKQAGFYVLGGAAMPAILIEIGFLTNPKEEKKLSSPEHREAIARAIYASLAEYKRRYDQRVRTVQGQPHKSEVSR